MHLYTGQPNISLKCKNLWFRQTGKYIRDLLPSAVVTVGELGGEGHVELIVRDVTEAAARGRRLLKPGEQHTPSGLSLHNSTQAVLTQTVTQTRIYNPFAQSLNHNNLWSGIPMSRQPSRIYRGFRMAAVPDADRMHTSSLCWGEMGQIKGERKGRGWEQDMKSCVYFSTRVCTTTYQMLVLSLYPTTAWQPSALAWDLISWRISSHQASRVSGSSAKHKTLN